MSIMLAREQARQLIKYEQYVTWRPHVTATGWGLVGTVTFRRVVTRLSHACPRSESKLQFHWICKQDLFIRLTQTWHKSIMLEFNL